MDWTRGRKSRTKLMSLLGSASSCTPDMRSVQYRFICASLLCLLTITCSGRGREVMSVSRWCGWVGVVVACVVRFTFQGRPV